MGLDMYLNRKTYVKHWDHKGDDNFKITVFKNSEEFKGINPKRISYIEEEVIYWRKANQIHNWFTKNVQNGNDDCGDYYVSLEQLKTLRDICENVLIESKLVDGIVKNGSFANKETNFKFKDNLELGKVIKDFSYAEENLPCSGGFFFGGTDYDEYYYNDVLETLNSLNEILNEDNIGDFYYSSSW